MKFGRPDRPIPAALLDESNRTRSSAHRSSAKSKKGKPQPGHLPSRPPHDISWYTNSDSRPSSRPSWIRSHWRATRVRPASRRPLRSGRLRPGTRLVNRTLAAELGTSTIPVREAISRLVSEGVLEFRPGAAAFVRSPDPNELGEIYDVRQLLEVCWQPSKPLDSRTTISSRTCANIAIASAPWPRPSRTVDMPHDFNSSGWLESEEAFHTRLVDASHNRWLVKVVKEIRVIAQVFAAQKDAPRLLTRDLALATVAQHDAFLRILAERDTEKAAAWMMPIFDPAVRRSSTTWQGNRARTPRRLSRRVSSTTLSPNEYQSDANPSRGLLLLWFVAARATAAGFQHHRRLRPGGRWLRVHPNSSRGRDQPGTALAFAEGRAANADQAKNKIVLKRSVDGGKTWEKLARGRRR